MRIERDEIWLCDDCTIVAVNGDATSLDYHYSPTDAAKRLEAIETGLATLGPHLVPSFDSETGGGVLEFSRHGCDCCNSGLAGSLRRFATLAP